MVETEAAGGIRRMAHALRFLAADAVEAAKSGHPGMPLGMADLAAVLFSRHLKFDAARPDWADRDRFVLSNGHGSMLLYGLLHLTGYPGVGLDELKQFRRAHARAAGHPEYRHFPGIETTTGPLGQGIATAVGMALAERMMNARFGDELVDHRTYVFCGDGCLMEGISQEAISLAGHLRLSRLTVIFDDNGTTIDGPTAVSTSDDQVKRFEASNWAAIAVDGHDPEAIDAALRCARASDRPTLIAARTRIGFGAPTKEGRSVVHGSPLGEAELAGLRQALDWPYPAFEIPSDIAEAWRAVGRRGETESAAWRRRLDQAEPARRAEFERRTAGLLPQGLKAAVEAALAALAETPQAIPVRQASRDAVGLLSRHMPEMTGGSADLTSSVLSQAEGMSPLAPGAFAGSHVAYGIREHAMAAALNGMALHGGLLPYGATYLTFSDYCRPSIRLAALMGIRVVFLFTHDSIGVGEDGPTHQPVEQLASLRAIPGLKVYRPADAVEALECWYDAVAGTGPSVMVAARQKVEPVRLAPASQMLSRRGAYVLAEAEGPRDVTLLATGSEVSLAVAARDLLAGRGVAAAVVSMPCWERFAEQPADYRRSVLGAAPRFAVEAASPFGWTRFVPDEDHVFGVTGFGFSGPGPEVYRSFGLTPEGIAARVLEALGRPATAE
ncbi:transketolase [Labrys wisconsinensis]|uniref:Transketolase n=1 Tax=Labrys wisconsinensis TaxID=425677 RepID=A0ABU0JM32_9HYPH|nr:transketolase [Labrys wisconsinensis]MDQ0474182.1 transketolase [Labrys wisconsinensis]